MAVFDDMRSKPTIILFTNYTYWKYTLYRKNAKPKEDANIFIIPKLRIVTENKNYLEVLFK